VDGSYLHFLVDAIADIDSVRLGGRYTPPRTARATVVRMMIFILE
jgi:hypothetical protein